ncbi:MAG: Asp-tRNA(Asn)/Glu-tRNA(Gln) amidotransferase subunit GatC [Myxococcota bacterium]
MRISPEEVQRIAALARVQLEPAALEQHACQLERILEHMEVLNQVKLADDVAIVHPHPTSLRPDVAVCSTPVALLTGQPALTQDAWFRVPRVIES